MNPDGPKPNPPLQVVGLVALTIATVGLAGWGARALRGRISARPAVATSGPSPRPVAISTPPDRGRLLYQVQCVRCHGVEGHGDGPDSADLRPGPRDFASGRWRLGPAPEALRKAIVEGIPGTAMYPTGGTFSPRDLDALVGHVLTLARGPALPDGLDSTLELAGFEKPSRLDAAPGIEVEDLEGNRRSLEFGRDGKLTLLVFWGTSCAPCQRELPELQRLAEDRADRGLRVVPVCVDEPDGARVARHLVGKFDKFPSFLDARATARLVYDVQTLPTSCLIDRRGDLLGVARGGVDWQGEPARRMIDGLLDRPE